MREIRGDVFQGRFHNLLISKNSTFWVPQISRITFQVVYLSEPRVGVPEKRGKRGRPRTRLHVLSRQRPHEVRALAHNPQTVWQQVVVRHTERSRLAADFALQRVWTVAGGKRPRAEWL